MIFIGIAAATVGSFIASAILYGSPPVSALLTETSTPRPGLSMALQMVSVLFRSLVVACLVAGLMAAASWYGPVSGAVLGLSLASIPAVLLLGAVVHENTPVPAAAVHLLDWTIKLIIIGITVGLFVSQQEA